MVDSHFVSIDPDIILERDLHGEDDVGVVGLNEVDR